MWSILEYFKIPKKLIDLLKMCYKDTRSRVKVGGELSGVFGTRSGLKQGCALSTLLFNLILEWVMRHTPPNTTPIKIGDHEIDRLAFADDVDLMGEKLGGVVTTYTNFKQTARRPGLEINQDKTKVMRATREEDEEGHVLMAGDRLEMVSQFKYLGSTVHSKNIIEREVTLRIGAGSRCSWALDKIIKSRGISRRTKVQVYTAIIRPIVLYGSETWQLTKELERRLEVFERTILRRIFGPVRDEVTGEWRWRHNQELMDLARIPVITSIQRSYRLRWAGHVARMGDERTPKRVMMGQLQGRRPLGRPKKRWSDNLREDLQQLGVDHRRWMEQAAERRTWRRLVRAARDHQGPRPPE